MRQQYSQKYTVVCFFKPQETFSNFSASEWPMHVTILDMFKTEWQLNRLCNELSAVAKTIVPFDTMPIEKVMLGEDKSIPVRLLQREGAILALRHRLMSLVDKGLFIFNTLEFVGEGFLPHATDQENYQVEIGRSYRLENISLVDMFPDDDYTRRRVIGTFNFNNQPLK